MSRLKQLCAIATALLLVAQPATPVWAEAYDGHPKIVVILVIDQFRADYLERYKADFKGRGFRLFLDHGAYFPDCYYGYANTKTAPGHATIGTGAYTDGHGISSNEWWDLARNKQRPVSSVEDERYGILGLPEPGVATADATQAPGSMQTQTPEQAQGTTQTQSASPSEKQSAAAPAAPAQANGKPAGHEHGASPRNLLASTVGDELRLATDGASEVWGISLKDRAAILPSGAAANGAFWIDAATGRFVTSTYYMQQLPDWATAFNEGNAIANAETEADVETLKSFYNQVGKTPAANSYELAFSEALITGEQLGKHPTTDMVTISLSANDILGHQVGPDSPDEHAMVDALDVQLDEFFSWLDKNVDGGLGNVWVALTADHGIAPTPTISSGLGMKGAYIDLKKLTANINETINEKFSPGENQPYLMPQQELPYLALNEQTFARAGINEQEAEQAVQNAIEGAVDKLTRPDDTSKVADAKLPPRPQVYRTYTRQQLATGELPRSQFGDLLAHSYSPNGGWYVMVLPIAYQMEGYANNTGTTHETPYSYDRHVPLGFYGAPFAPGTYHGRVQPVDLAATFASLLGVNQPSASVGQVLTQALKPAAAVVYPKEPLPPSARRRVRGARRPEAAEGAAEGASTPEKTGSPAAPAKSPSPAPTPPSTPASPGTAAPPPERAQPQATPNAPAPAPTQTPPQGTEKAPQ
jgi:predicted AlkP superfamily pyrophosphatase or phosphodiesterase